MGLLGCFQGSSLSRPLEQHKGATLRPVSGDTGNSPHARCAVASGRGLGPSRCAQGSAPRSLPSQPGGERTLTTLSTRAWCAPGTQRPVLWGPAAAQQWPIPARDLAARAQASEGDFLPLTQPPAATSFSPREGDASDKAHASGTPGVDPRVLVGMLAAALVLCSADRVIMSVCIVPLSTAHGWSPTTAGVVQSSFLWGYALTPILGGALADARGGHPVLAAGMALWSLATLLTPWAALGVPGTREGGGWPVGVLLAVRAAMGLGEGVALPCMNNLVSRFVPPAGRAMAVALCFVGFHLGCMLGLLAAPSLMSLPSTQVAPLLGLPPLSPLNRIAPPFLFFGTVGFLWLLVWSFLGRGYALGGVVEGGMGPANLAVGSGEAAREGSKAPPFGMLLSHAPVWAIICANAVNNWGYFILLSWMPLFLKQVTGLDLRQAAWFSALPWAVMAATSVLAGFTADSLAQRGWSTTRIRKTMQAIGFLGPCLALLALTSVKQPQAAVALLTVALGSSSFSQAGFLLNYKDIAPRFVGVLHGISNTAGTLAGILSTVASGIIVDRLGSFSSVLLLTSLFYAVGTAVWLTFSTGEVVIE